MDVAAIVVVEADSSFFAVDRRLNSKVEYSCDGVRIDSLTMTKKRNDGKESRVAICGRNDMERNELNVRMLQDMLCWWMES